MHRAHIIGLLAILALVVAACGGESPDTATDEETAPPEPAEEPAEEPDEEPTDAADDPVDGLAEPTPRRGGS